MSCVYIQVLNPKFVLCIVELRPSYYWIKLGLASLVIVYYFKNWKVNYNNIFYKY